MSKGELRKIILLPRRLFARNPLKKEAEFGIIQKKIGRLDKNSCDSLYKFSPARGALEAGT